MAKKKPQRKKPAAAKSKKKPPRTNLKRAGAARGKKKTAPRAGGNSAARPARKSSWLDEQANKPIIEKHARRLGSFMEALADGKVDQAELASQEKRLVKIMQEVEGQLPPALHQQVTRLLYELTAYDLMHILHSMEQARPKTAFRG